MGMRTFTIEAPTSAQSLQSLLSLTDDHKFVASVRVVAPRDNAAGKNVFVGDSAAQPVDLSPGDDSDVLPTNDTSLIYIRGEQAGLNATIIVGF